MKRTTTWNGLHPRLCLNSSRKHVLHPLHIVMLREVRDHELFEIHGTHLTTVQDPVQPDQSGSRAPPSRWDRCSTPRFLVHGVHFIVLCHDVLQLRASDVSSVSPAMYTTSHTSLLPSTSTSTSRSIASSLTSRLTLVSHSRVKLNGARM